jgi:hypothetical protein
LDGCPCAPVQVHHVVDVAGPRAFAECAQLFPEGLLVRVAIGPNPAVGTVGVRMKHLAMDRGKHQPLICRQVELDLWPSARYWEVQAGSLRDPADDFFEHRP